ncbi:23S rRNA (pseudouridine(1915)-N(3))-methyltransferase RlmH [Robiginitalea sp. SC105]|uniref:23S rRNA (pseudouridine(1915)-N(3))-methyltransferase RlmH n=1 Tax=Robiginitalea sp. SC105 TaxID=2762332 RepID=UPI001639EF8A|nr:23S rRNA (pseudouridine(1915)-N(3))-methyltransferase RlmH [Robiginitalea sp. SC105]MBC2839479.1 23S rRNA (pseudouridine(1915)-N(3))-methyltransferase RlmH [Robiginitalea sp. SC105]
MKVILLAIGKTDSAPLESLIGDFSRRIGRYIPFKVEIIPDIRLKGKPDPTVIKQREAELLLRALQPQDAVWLLDEKGREYTSRGFASRLQKCMNAGPKRLVLVIGGAFGFDGAVRERADALVSLSRMTYNHQVVRLLAVEQLYRGFSILRGDPYHND